MATPQAQLDIEQSAVHLLVSSPLADDYQVVETLQDGLRWRNAEQLRQFAGLTTHEFADALNVSERTYQRRRNALLSAGMSNRAYRLGQLVDQAIELYNGDLETGLRWLKTPNAALDHKTPFTVLQSEVGADQVERLIGQLRAGINPA